MTFFYLSFCDVTKPKGTQFLGATVVEADDPGEAIERATALGINPGGEVAMRALSIASRDEFPPEGLQYLDKFVSRDHVLSDPNDVEDLKADAVVCQDCNPRNADG